MIRGPEYRRRPFVEAMVNGKGWGLRRLAPQKDGFPTVSPARCWDVGRFFRACAEPQQRVGAGELFDWFERICRQRMCAFLRESKDALDPKASKQRARNGTNEPNASIRNREEACEGESRRCFRRCREHHDDPRCARRGISQGPRLTTLGMQQSSTSSIACLETTLTYIVKVAVVFLARHRGPVGDDDNLHVLGLADDSLYRISGQ